MCNSPMPVRLIRFSLYVYWDMFKSDKCVQSQEMRQKGKEKQTHLDVPRHVEGCGEQVKTKNGRKLGRSKETKWRNTKKN
jgi:hypothetical protein